MKKYAILVLSMFIGFSVYASALDDMYSAAASSEAAAEDPMYQRARETAGSAFDGPTSGDGYYIYTGDTEIDGAEIDWENVEDVRELEGSTDFFNSDY